MWDEIDIKKKTYFYFKFFLMKKIILLVIALVWLSGFGFVVGDCSTNPMIPWCPDWEFTMKNKCLSGGWFPSINWTECICTRFMWTQLERQDPCATVPSLEEVALSNANCDWGQLLENWTCCPAWSKPYDNNKKCCPSWSEVYDNEKKCCNWQLYNGGTECCEKSIWVKTGDQCLACSSTEAKSLDNYVEACSQDVSDCDSDKIYTDDEWLQKCCDWWMLVPDSQDSSKKVCIINTAWNLWINMSSDCLINWQCSYNIYKTLWIRQSDQNPKVSTFVQDIVLWITMFLWTVITIILITSWILYILAAILWKSNLADMAKKWIFNSILWLLLVTWSYAIVRLIQFVATAGWG